VKITFVVCNIQLGSHRRSLVPQWESTYREGIASIAALLRANGFEVGLLKLSAGLSRARLAELWTSRCADTDLAAFTINTVDNPEAARIARILKAHQPRLLTICGGVHPTLSPEECITEPAFDLLCRGEGEHVMLELCAKLQSGGGIDEIRGLWTKRAGAIRRNAPRPLIADLSALPPPARDLSAVSDYDQSKVQDTTFFMATRGCPYQCAYCCNHSISQIYPNPQDYHRFKSVDAMIDELRAHLARHPAASWVALYDDAMMGNRRWFADFSARYARDVARRSFMTARWELLDEQAIPLLKKLRVVYTLVGLEVGDEHIRREVLNRRQSDELMLQRGALLRQHGIRYGVYTMVGVPTETHEQALKTVKLAARVGGNPLLGHHTIYFPFEGTPLHARCMRDGLLSERRVDSYFSDTRLEMPGFTRAEVRWAHRHFKSFRLGYWLTGKLPRSLRQPLDRALDRRWLRGGRRARDAGAA
jgi:anaerobic magnesium-protoporphyrin IX monomethyl ester cyclase